MPNTDSPPSSADAPPLVVTAAEAGQRLDRFLATRLPGLGRRGAVRLLEAGALTLERPGAPRPPLRKATLLEAGDRVHVAPEALAAEAPAEAPAGDAPPAPAPVPGVTVVHEDPALVVLAKPAGVPTHPLRPGETGTLANHLAARFPETLAVGGPAREAGLAHRLDTLTSGLLVAARTAEAYDALRALFRDHRVDKAYLALVWGAPPDTFVVDAPIASRRGRRKVTVLPAAGASPAPGAAPVPGADPGPGAGPAWARGLPAETHVRVAARYGASALVEARTRFGRRHQVRAHLAHAGHPLVADPLYAPSATAADRPSPEGPWPLLHASLLAFDHPVTGARLELTLPLPPHVQAALDRLGPS